MKRLKAATVFIWDILKKKWKKKSKKSSKVEIFTMVKIQNILSSYKKSLLDIFSTSCDKPTN